MDATDRGGAGRGVRQQRPDNTSKYSGNVKVSGSTTVLPLAQEASAGFMDANPDANVDVQGGGSSVGITQVKEGVVDIGTSSRDLKPEENADNSLVPPRSPWTLSP